MNGSPGGQRVVTPPPPRKNWTSLKHEMIYYGNTDQQQQSRLFTARGGWWHPSIRFRAKWVTLAFLLNRATPPLPPSQYDILPVNLFTHELSSFASQSGSDECSIYNPIGHFWWRPFQQPKQLILDVLDQQQCSTLEKAELQSCCNLSKTSR